MVCHYSNPNSFMSHRISAFALSLSMEAFSLHSLLFLFHIFPSSGLSLLESVWEDTPCMFISKRPSSRGENATLKMEDQETGSETTTWGLSQTACSFAVSDEDTLKKKKNYRRWRLGEVMAKTKLVQRDYLIMNFILLLFSQMNEVLTRVLSHLKTTIQFLSRGRDTPFPFSLSLIPLPKNISSKVAGSKHILVKQVQIIL